MDNFIDKHLRWGRMRQNREHLLQFLGLRISTIMVQPLSFQFLFLKTLGIWEAFVSFCSFLLKTLIEDLTLLREANKLERGGSLKQSFHGELPKHKIQVLYGMIQKDTWIFSKYFLLLTVGFMILFVFLVKWISWEMTRSSRTCLLLISSKTAEKLLQKRTLWLVDGETRFWLTQGYFWWKLLGFLQSAASYLVFALWPPAKLLNW